MLLAALQGLGSAKSAEMEALDTQEKDLKRQRDEVVKTIAAAKKRSKRLREKASKNLTAAELAQMAAEKLVVEQKGKGKGKGKA